MSAARSLVLALLVAAASHATYVANGFTYQDHGDIEGGRAVRPLSHLPSLVLERWGDTGYYRPLVTAVHSVDHAVYGLWAPGYHVTNLLLHLGFTAAVWLFARRFAGLTATESAVAAAFAGVHPISWLIVGGITFRQEILVALLTLLAVAHHVRAREDGRALSIAAAAGSFALALLSKETALAWFPAIVLVWEVGAPRRPATARLPLAGAYAAIAAVYLLLRSMAVPEHWRVAALDLAPGEAIATRAIVLARLLLQIVLPVLPSHSDATPIVGLGDPAALASLAILIAGTIAAIRLGPRTPVGRALLFMGIALAPALQILPLPRFSSPHYAHLATVGAGLLMALAVRRAQTAGPSVRSTVHGLAAAWIAVAGIVTLKGGPRFHDDVALFAPEVAADPDFVEGHMQLGLHFMLKGDHERAAAAFEESLRPRPGVLAFRDDKLILVNLANVRAAQGRVREAELLLAEAAPQARASEAASIAGNRAFLAAQRGDDAAVVELLLPHVGATTRPEPLMLLARSLGRLGRRQESMDVLRRMLPLVDGESRRRLEQLVASAGTP
jgi:tetratricopeptide (TPR) repeat protein